MTQTTPTNSESVALVSLADLILESARPTDWLIDGIYATGEAVLVSGASHSGKTYLLLDQGLAVAYGRPWLGRYATRQAPVIYSPSEGRGGIGRRVTSAIEHHYPYDDVAGFFLFPEVLDLTNGPSLSNLARATKQTDAGLIIVDVLRDATPGVEENSAAMGDAFGKLRDLAQYTGATVLVAHHLGKDTTKGSRGHSSLKDKADQEVLVKGTAVADGIGGIQYTVVSMENSKNRNQDNWGTLSLDLRKTNPNGSPVIVGDRSQTATEGLAPAYGASMHILDAIDDLDAPATNLYTSQGCTSADLVEATGTARQNVAKDLKALISEGFVEVDKTGKAHRFSLTAKGKRATAYHLHTTEHAGGPPACNRQHPIGAGVYAGRRTVVEELLAVEALEHDPSDLGEPETFGDDTMASVSDILGADTASTE